MAERLSFTLALNTSSFVDSLKKSAKQFKEAFSNAAPSGSGSNSGSGSGQIQEQKKRMFSLQGLKMRFRELFRFMELLKKDSKDVGWDMRKHMTGNVKAAIKDAKNNWTGLCSQLSNSKSFRESGEAMSQFVGKMGGSLVKLAGKFGPAILAIGALVLLLTKLAEGAVRVAVENERAAFRVQRAFKTGGKMDGTRAAKYNGAFSGIEFDAMLGRVDKSKMMESVASARQNFQSVDEKSFKKMVKMSPNLGAHLGMGAGDAMLKLGNVLDGLSVSFDEAKELGLSLTREELARINALKAAGEQEKANAEILDKVAEASKKARKEYEETLGGQFEKFKNISKETFGNIGKILTAYLVPMLKFVNNIGVAINKIASDIFNVLCHLVKTVRERGKEFFGFGDKDAEKKKKEAENKDAEKKKKEAENYVDPRLQLSVNFEGSKGMADRIQQAIMERNSPQVQQVKLLEKIHAGVGMILDTSDRSHKTAENNLRETSRGNKILEEKELGMPATAF